MGYADGGASASSVADSHDKAMHLHTHDNPHIPAGRFLWNFMTEPTTFTGKK